MQLTKERERRFEAVSVIFDILAEMDRLILSTFAIASCGFGNIFRISTLLFTYAQMFVSMT